MAKFIAVHTMPKELLAKPEEAAPIAKKVKESCTLDAYWVRSWIVPEMGKVYCEWDAKDGESVRKVLEKVPEMPLDAVYQMKIVDSEDYR